MKKCKYAIKFPDMKLHCMVYSCSKRPDGKWWAHFPKCSEKRCPFKHPELLEGAVFDREEFNKILQRAKEKEIGRG